MTLRACIEDQIGRLVHPSAHAAPAEAIRHRMFIARRLAVSFTALGFVPLYLVAGGVPGRIEAAVLAWLMLPLLAVAYVSTTGRIDRGELLSFLGWGGLAATLLLGRVCGAGPAIGLLVLVPLETALGEGGVALRRAILFAVASAIGLAACAVWVAAGRQASPVDVPLLLCIGLYGGLLALLNSRRHMARQQGVILDLDRSRALSRSVGDVVLRLGRSGAVTEVIKAAGARSGLQPGELVGRGLFDRIHVADRPLFLKSVSDAATGDDAVVLTLRLRVGSKERDDGAFAEPVFATVELRLRRLSAEQADVAGISEDVVAVLNRASDGNAEPEFAKVAVAADDSAWKDRFLATVSHELRTPLNAIIGFSDILSSDLHAPESRAKQREYASIIHVSALHLLSVVNSVLDKSKIDAGKFELTVEPFDVVDLIGSCRDMVHLQAQQGRIDLICNLDAGLPELVGDKRACKQIVLNLLSNALKFTPAYGSVTIVASTEADMLVIQVTDTGIGIRPEDMTHLGDPFFQAENALDRRYEGTGLGLSVVSGLVGLHGGTIIADSAPGEGTRMIVRLPIAGRPQLKATRASIEVLPRRQRAGAAQPIQDLAKVQKRA